MEFFDELAESIPEAIWDSIIGAEVMSLQVNDAI